MGRSSRHGDAIHATTCPQKRAILATAQCSTVRNAIPRTKRKRTYTPSRNLFVFNLDVIPSGVTNLLDTSNKFPTFCHVCEMVCKGCFPLGSLCLECRTSGLHRLAGQCPAVGCPGADLGDQKGFGPCSGVPDRLAQLRMKRKDHVDVGTSGGYIIRAVLRRPPAGGTRPRVVRGGQVILAQVGCGWVCRVWVPAFAGMTG